MKELAGNIIIGTGLLFMLFGIIGLIRYKDFYTRILLTSKIDIVCVNTILIGVAVRHWRSYFSLKALILMGVMLLVTPLVSHMIARSAHLSNKENRQNGDDNERQI